MESRVNRFIAPLVSLTIAASYYMSAGFYSGAAQAQTADLISLIKARQLAHQQGTLPPAAIIPDTVPFSYVVTREMKTSEGDEVTTQLLEYKMNPSAAPGARIELLTGVMDDLPKDVRRELERYNNEMSPAEIADEFWCEDNDEESPFDADFEASDITVISETDKLANVKIGKNLLGTFVDVDGDMPKKIRKNLSIEAMISKPELKVMDMRIKLMKPELRPID